MFECGHLCTCIHLIDWLIDRLIDWSIEWWLDRLRDAWLMSHVHLYTADWLIDWLIDWLMIRSTAWCSSAVTCAPVYSWLIDWLIDWWLDWLRDARVRSHVHLHQLWKTDGGVPDLQAICHQVRGSRGQTKKYVSFLSDLQPQIL